MRWSFHEDLESLYTCGAGLGLQGQELEEDSLKQAMWAPPLPQFESSPPPRLTLSFPVGLLSPYLCVESYFFPCVTHRLPLPLGSLLTNNSRVLGARASHSQKALQVPQATWGCPTLTCSIVFWHEGFEYLLPAASTQGLAHSGYWLTKPSLGI